MIEVELTVPPELARYPDLVAAALPEIAHGVRNEIVALAQRELHTSGSDYLQGLSVLSIPVTADQLRRSQPTFLVLTLTGWLPNAVEHGWEGGDMKPFLLDGRNAKVGKDGKRYNTVPFRHGTPGTSGRYFPAMGEVHAKHGASGSPGGLSRSDSEQLGRKVHRAARQLAGTTSHPRAGTTWGERLEAGTAPKLTNRVTGYEHKTDIFAGMVRKEKTYQRATQSFYMTFRRVSANSDPGSWHHPGIARRGLFARASERIGDIAGLIFQGAVHGLHPRS